MEIYSYLVFLVAFCVILLSLGTPWMLPWALQGAFWEVFGVSFGDLLATLGPSGPLGGSRCRFQLNL